MAKIDKRGDHPVHERGWGYEVWIENIPEYCGKVLVLESGKRSSLHFHMKKKETMYLESGLVIIKLIDPETGKEYGVELNEKDSLLIPQGQTHQIIAMKNSRLFEFSTIHDELDSYRVEKGD